MILLLVELNRFETLFSCFCCQTFLFLLELFRKRFLSRYVIWNVTIVISKKGNSEKNWERKNMSNLVFCLTCFSSYPFVMMKPILFQQKVVFENFLNVEKDWLNFRFVFEHSANAFFKQNPLLQRFIIFHFSFFVLQSWRMK